MKYLGYIDKSQNYYNFFPLGSFDSNGRLSLFTDYERKHLFQDRNKHNYINLYFRNFEVPESMEDLIQPLSLVVLNFDPPETESDGDDNFTFSRYSVDAVQAFEREDLMELDQEGLFVVLDESALENELNTTRSVRLEEPEFYIMPGSDIYVRLNENKAISGPFRVHHSTPTLHDEGYYFILPELAEKKYQLDTLKGTHTTVVDLEGLDYNDSIPVQLLRYPDSFEAEKLDLSTDEQLLNDFQRSIHKPGFANQPIIKSEEFNDLLNEFNTSLFGGKYLDQKIIDSRRNRLFDLIRANTYHSELTDQLNDYFSNIVAQNENDEIAVNLIAHLFEKNPALKENFFDHEETEKITQELETQKNLFKTKEAELLKNVEEEKDKVESLLQEKKKLELQVLALKDQIQTLQHTPKAVQTVLFEEVKEVAGSQDLDGFKSRRIRLQQEIAELEAIQKYLISRNETLENGLQKLFSDSGRLIEKSLDGFYYNGLKKAAWKQEQKQVTEKLLDQIMLTDRLARFSEDEESSLNYLMELLKAQRMELSENEIYNLLLALVLEPLVLIGGPSGSGKTTLVQLLAKSLGLMKVDQDLRLSDLDNPESHFIQVNVERGWNTKRDWIGFEDPESEKLYAVNDDLLNGLRLADLENQNARFPLPLLVLLDKANHSPMEYYLSELLEEDPDGTRNLKIGNHEKLEIPENVHFIATLNQDSGMEPISGSVLDRSICLILDKPIKESFEETTLPISATRILDWDRLKLELVPEGASLHFSPEIEPIFEELKKILSPASGILSWRNEKKIRRYWNAASRLFKKNEKGILPEYIALDYAISQYLLTKLRGPFDELEPVLDQLNLLFRNYHLEKSLKLTEKLQEQGQKELFVQLV